MTWNDISVKQFIEIQNIITDESMELDERILALIFTVFGVSPDEMNLIEYQRYVKELDFLKEEVKRNDLEPEYIINEHKYYVHTNPNLFTVAQLADYNNYVSMGNPMTNIDKFLSIILIPEGKTYNKDYDILEAIKDFRSMPITDAMAPFFYYRMLLKRSVDNILKSLTKQIKKTKISKEEKQMIQMKIKQLTSGVLYL